VEPNTQRRRGRRPAGQDAKSAIVAAARDRFAEFGYSGASVRSIARAADVDPALIRHYFRDKAGLFAAASDLPVARDDLLAEFESYPRDRLGEGLARAFFAVWDTPKGHERLRVLIATAPGEPQTLRALSQFASLGILGAIGQSLGGDNAHLRVTLAGTHLMGVMLGRVILGIEPIASLPLDRLVAWVSPGLTRLLTGPEPPQTDARR
jgi:AcrR family transcriptional regulator